MILKPTRAIENKEQILEMANLILGMKQDLVKLNPKASQEDLQWALEQAIMRLSIRDGHSFETGV